MNNNPFAPPKSNIEGIKKRTMVAEGKPAIVVKIGFNWAAMFFGPFWAAFKSFWPAAIALAVVNVGLRLIVKEVISSGFPLVALSLGIVQIGIAITVGFYANSFYAAYLSTKGYKLLAQTPEANSVPQDA